MITSVEISDSELGLLDVRLLDVENEQTWLCSSAQPDREDFDIQSWKNEAMSISGVMTDEQKRNIIEMVNVLESVDIGSNKQRFDSRTYTRPKKKMLRPSIYGVMGNDNQGNILNNTMEFMCGTKTITKHSRTFTEDGRQLMRPNTNTYRKVKHDIKMDDDMMLVSDDILEGEFLHENASKPININLSEPAHNLHNTFNRISNTNCHKNNSIANMSPPSLVSSIAMEDSGAFNSFSRQGSISSNKSCNINEQDDLDLVENMNHNSLISNIEISLLNESEMSTSLLSHCQDDILIKSPLPSMSNSVESSLINSGTFANASPSRNIMENSLVNSGTFNSILEPIDDKFPNGQSKFQLRKSFLKPDPEDNFDKFLILNSKYNTDDLRGLSSDFLKNTRSKYDTYKKSNEKENYNINNKDESFLMGDGMSDSFLKETGKESLSTSKLSLGQQRVRTVNRPQIELEKTVVLPNQVMPSHNLGVVNTTFTKKLNGTYDAMPKERESPNNGTYDAIPKERESPKRNATFRKVTPPSTGNTTTVLITHQNDDIKDNQVDIIDSNKECYKSVEDIRDNQTFDKDKKAMGDDFGSSDIPNESPHNVVPLNMDDLEHLAYEQEQKLYQVVSTPISKPTLQSAESSDMLFTQNFISPIHNQHKNNLRINKLNDSQLEGTRYGYNTSSLGNLHRLNVSPKKSTPVKRESSAPEIKSRTPKSYRSPLNQKLGLNKYQYEPAQDYNVQNEGLFTSRSVGGSPAKSSTPKHSGLERPLHAAPLQLSGSDNELRMKKSGLPASKLRQYSSHKELNRIPGGGRISVGGSLSTLRSSSRLSFYASNPVLCPKPLVRQASYTIVSKDGGNSGSHRDFVKPVGPGIRQPSNSSNAGGAISYGEPLKAKHSIGMAIPSAVQLKVESIQPPSKPLAMQNSKPQTNAVPQRLPRPSGLPRPSSGIPKRPPVRPQSTYSLAPKHSDEADCY